MTLEQQLEEIIELWAKNPLSEEFVSDPGNSRLCTIQGVQQQIENLPSGEGTIIVTFLNDAQQIEIKTIKVFKQ